MCRAVGQICRKAHTKRTVAGAAAVGVAKSTSLEPWIEESLCSRKEWLQVMISTPHRRGRLWHLLTFNAPWYLATVLCSKVPLYDPSHLWFPAVSRLCCRRLARASPHPPSSSSAQTEIEPICRATRPGSCNKLRRISSTQCSRAL